MPNHSDSAQIQIGFGHVWHQRLRPATNAFRYPSFFVMLPLRSLRRTPASWNALAHNRPGLLSFRDRDHGDGRADALDWFEELLRAEGVVDADGEVWLQTYPRLLGYAFKPVSFWYAHRADGSLAAVVAEVNNTFGERHCYLLSGPGLGWGTEQRASKVFHVSPFCGVQGNYCFRFLRSVGSLRDAHGHVHVTVDLHDEVGILLRTSIGGALEVLGPATTRRAVFGMPFMTLAVILRIHWQALRLAYKRVPFFSKPTAPEKFVTR